jgi:hypothetical protein
MPPDRATSLGFVILSHGDPALLARLVDRLNGLYGCPPIACHHDHSQAPLNQRAFPANVRFVTPHIATGWGRLSVVEAGLAAMRLLVATADPDWMMLLSAADYPVCPAASVLDELARSPYDAYLDARPVRGQPSGAATFAETPNSQLTHFELPGLRRLKWQFYVAAQVWLPIPKSRPHWRVGRITRPLPFAGIHPFRHGFAAYYGDHWFTANRRAAQSLLAPTREQKRLYRHLRLRAQADECYYQTILANTPGLNICLDNKRYAEWRGGNAHPVLVERQHVPAILASGAHFARKFALGSAAIPEIDRAID